MSLEIPWKIHRLFLIKNYLEGNENISGFFTLLSLVLILNEEFSGNYSAKPIGVIIPQK